MGIHERLSGLPTELFRQWTARDTRYAVDGVTTVTATDGRSAPALVLNVSNAGCRIGTRLAVQPGDRLTFVLEPLGLVEAEVRWTAGDEAGLSLLSRDANYTDYSLSYPD